MIQKPYFDVFRRFGVFAIRVSFNIKCTFETKANIKFKNHWHSANCHGPNVSSSGATCAKPKPSPDNWEIVIEQR